jgi:hypothetical protein
VAARSATSCPIALPWVPLDLADLVPVAPVTTGRSAIAEVTPLRRIPTTWSRFVIPPGDARRARPLAEKKPITNVSRVRGRTDGAETSRVLRRRRPLLPASRRLPSRPV